MAAVGPWLPDRPHLPVAIAVSGGADSLCLAILARRWRRAVIAFVVDHGLRETSRTEADLTCARLTAHDIRAVRLDIYGLSPGAGLQARARKARYDVLTEACVSHGCIDLLLGHHARDQAETVLIRKRAKSGPDGLAGMAVVAELASLRLVRPLLGVAPGQLRARLVQDGIEWVEDASNTNCKFERVRIRQRLTPARVHRVCSIASRLGHLRMKRAADTTRELANQVTAHPAGWVLLPATGVSAVGYSSLIQAITGASHRISSVRIADLIREDGRPFTIGGARIVLAGRYSAGWIMQPEQRVDAAFRLAAGRMSAADTKFLPATIRAVLPTFGDCGFEIAACRAATDESLWG